MYAVKIIRRVNQAKHGKTWYITPEKKGVMLFCFIN